MARTSTTSYQYDGLNRVTRITPTAGNFTTIGYTATSKTATRGALVETDEL
jgi:YD repeat-containing protein